MNIYKGTSFFDAYTGTNYIINGHSDGFFFGLESDEWNDETNEFINYKPVRLTKHDIQFKTGAVCIRWCGESEVIR